MTHRLQRRKLVGASVALALLASVRAFAKPGKPMPRIALVFGIPPAADIAGPASPVRPAGGPYLELVALQELLPDHHPLDL